MRLQSYVNTALVSWFYPPSTHSRTHTHTHTHTLTYIQHGTGTYKVPTFRAENETLEASMHRVANGNTHHNNSTTKPLVSQGRISRGSNVSQDTYEEVPLNRSRTRDICSGMVKRMFRTKRKKILKGISVYFNPGEMIGIMGPSGVFDLSPSLT